MHFFLNILEGIKLKTLNILKLSLFLSDFSRLFALIFVCAETLFYYYYYYYFK
jgi:hypothetical protein